MSTPNLEPATEVHAACHLTAEFTLRSGPLSHEYFDKYLFEADERFFGTWRPRWGAASSGCAGAGRRASSSMPR